MVRLLQVWIIMNNGICPIHILYSGQDLEENLFAAFVRALFSFSKDMSQGEKSISSMTLGDMDIHYLAQKEEKYFVAISAEVGISQEEINVYLNYISNLFAIYYPEYIEKVPPFEPTSFRLFKESIDYFIRYNENKLLLLSKGEKNLDLSFEIKSSKASIDKIVFQSKSDNIIKIVNKSDLTIEGTFYPLDGEIAIYDIQKKGNLLCIISEKNDLLIIPLPLEKLERSVKIVHLESSVSWITIHPTQERIFFGKGSQVFEYNNDLQKLSKYECSITIKESVALQNDFLLIKNDNNLLQIIKTNDFSMVIDQPNFKDKVYSFERGSDDIIIIKCLNQSVCLWKNETFFQLKERYPISTHISSDDTNKILFLITEFNEFLVYDSNDGTLLVNYNLVESGISVTVIEGNKLVVFYENGFIKWFLGTIDRDEIAQLRNFLTKRVENVENNIIRIHTGFQKIILNLDNKYRSSLVLKNDLNQVKVFKQQLKKLIDDKLIERTSILRDLYFRLLGYQKQVQSLINLITQLENDVELSFKKTKENELSGKTPKERIDEFLELMKPRDQIGLGTLAETLQLPYEDCLNHLKTLESRGLLPGFLTRGSSLSIKDNVLFIKKDPKFEETGITSF